MEPELRAALLKYAMIAVVLTGAAIWAVAYVADDDVKHRNGAPTLVAQLPDGGPAAATPAALAPSVKDLIVSEGGVERVACAPACRLEAYCGLRDVDGCLKQSCNGKLRVPVASDTGFARADDCTAAAAAPCADACAKRDRCGTSHDVACVARCTAAVAADKGVHAGEIYRAARCVLEATSCDLAACAPL